MVQATQVQYATAIQNFRRSARDFRIRAANEREGSWEQRADLRIAARADQQADDLERAQRLAFERDIRIARIKVLHT